MNHKQHLLGVRGRKIFTVFLLIVGLQPAVGVIPPPQALGQTQTQTDVQRQAMQSISALFHDCFDVRNTDNAAAGIRALRQLRDPELAPFFESLFQSSNPELKAHGLLALVENKINPTITPEDIAQIKSEHIQIMCLGSAVTDELLTDEQALVLINSPQVANPAKLSLATQVLRHGALKVDAAQLRPLLESKNFSQRAMTNLLLAHMGDKAAMNFLHSLLDTEKAAQVLAEELAANMKNKPDPMTEDHHRRVRDSARNELKLVRAVLLETAARCGFESIGPWALQLSRDPDITPDMEAIALRAALRLGAPGAVQHWQQRYASTEDMARKLRLTLHAMYSAPFVTPQLFEPMTKEQMPLLQQFGRTGQAVASQTNVPQQVMKLIELNYPPATKWAMSYANTYADANDAKAIYVGVIIAFEGDRQNKAARFELASSATELLFDLDPKSATELLRSFLSDASVEPALVRGILMGLLSSATRGTDLVVKDLPAVADRTSDNYVVILKARGQQQLSAEQMDRLALLASGGGNLPRGVRIQAGWAYLKLINQHKQMLADVIRSN